MRAPKNFEEYVEKGVVRKQTPDKARAENLAKEADRKHNSLKMVLEKIGLINENANDVIEDCYDIIINLSRSKMFLEGFSASGKGAHEAEVAYLRRLDFSEVEIDFINQLRYFRNGILYYGKLFDKEYAEKVVDFMEKIREKIK